MSIPPLALRSARRGALLVACCGLALSAAQAQTPVQAQRQAPGGGAPYGTWQRCASEDEICRFNGEALVRYGIDGQYNYRTARNRVICDRQEFGDPAYGRVKQCDFTYDQRLRDGRGGGGGGRAGGSDWIYCAVEGETCRFEGTARVRFGAEYRYAYRNAIGSVPCGQEAFGDPAFGVRKQCEYQPLQAASGSPPQNVGWDHCASEGGVCSFNGTAEVRYGANGRFVSRNASNSTPCTTEAFGRDPVFGEPKHCYVRSATR